jgi:hypothetical protein
MIKVFIYDASQYRGSPRRDFLHNQLAKCKVDVHNWKRGVVVPTTGEEILFLVHFTDLLTSQKSDLEASAAGGASVVHYGGGLASLGWSQAGKGEEFSISWDVFEQVLDQLPNSFDLADFRLSVEAVGRRSVVNALAILCWCATFPTTEPDVVRRQEKWRQDREMWRKVFAKPIRQEVLAACALPVTAKLPARLDEVSRFLAWLDGIGPDQNWPSPKFEKVLTELQAEFGVRL